MTRKRGERDLFGIVVQPRLVKPEPPELYAAVMKLRRSGLQVFRAGRDRHVIRNLGAGRGARVTTVELFVMAEKAMGWNPNR